MEKNLVISQSDASLADLIASQPTSVDVKSKKNFNPWELPEECNKFVDTKLRYRWVSKDKRMVERARYRGWLICNRVNSPYLPERLFSVHGGLERYGHLLAFRPMEMAIEDMKESSEKSRSAVKHYTEDIKKDPRFYDAKLGGDDGSDDNPSGIQQGRDF